MHCLSHIYYLNHLHPLDNQLYYVRTTCSVYSQIYWSLKETCALVKTYRGPSEKIKPYKGLSGAHPGSVIFSALLQSKFLTYSRRSRLVCSCTNMQIFPTSLFDKTPCD